MSALLYVPFDPQDGEDDGWDFVPDIGHPDWEAFVAAAITRAGQAQDRAA